MNFQENYFGYILTNFGKNWATFCFSIWSRCITYMEQVRVCVYYATPSTTSVTELGDF